MAMKVYKIPPFNIPREAPLDSIECLPTGKERWHVIETIAGSPAMHASTNIPQRPIHFELISHRGITFDS